MKIHLALAAAFLAVAPVTTVMAASQDEEQACMNDAFNVCGHAIPDRDRVATCLYQNISRISPACRTVLSRYQKPTTTAERIKATAVR
ncbi:MAG: hypothetical protein AB1490_05220 [Pseudomonadota bacterium]